MCNFSRALKEWLAALYGWLAIFLIGNNTPPQPLFEEDTSLKTKYNINFNINLKINNYGNFTVC